MKTRVLIACDKFKDALTAGQVCQTIETALQRVQPTWSTDSCPLTDGGDGFCEILTRAAGGALHEAMSPDPLGRLQHAPFGLVAVENLPSSVRSRFAALLGDPLPTQIAVVEMAAISGLARLATTQRDPWKTTTCGTGVLLHAAAHAGAGLVVLGIGGSATHDLGLGALQALGMQFHDSSGHIVTPPVPSEWPRIASIRGQVAADLPPIAVAVDVTNPLLGSDGAAAVFAPQKGLPPGDIERLEAASAAMAKRLCEHCGRTFEIETRRGGSGAAGGLGFGLAVAASAAFLPGSALVAEWLELDERLARADIVITGEGRWDASSLQGKGPGALAVRARALGKRVCVLAGAQVGAQDSVAEVHVITPAGQPLAIALDRTRENLAATVAQLFGGAVRNLG